MSEQRDQNEFNPGGDERADEHEVVRVIMTVGTRGHVGQHEGCDHVERHLFGHAQQRRKNDLPGEATQDLRQWSSAGLIGLDDLCELRGFHDPQANVEPSADEHEAEKEWNSEAPCHKGFFAEDGVEEGHQSGREGESDCHAQLGPTWSDGPFV